MRYSVGDMQKYKMLLHYRGTRYSGWQIQKDRPTIQGILQEAIQQVAGERASVVGAGRTDSGVHARGQVAHFRLGGEIPAPALRGQLNGVLPWDIRVIRLAPAAATFHAQRDAIKKRYEYRIYNGPVLSPFLHNLALQVRRKMDVEAIQEAAGLLCGEHDFSAFAASGSRVKSRTRTTMLSRIRSRGLHLCYQIEADGFLHHMVRNIVGTLLEVGTGRRSVDEITTILKSQDRRNAGPTAPPHGLYMMRVYYEA
ncbi:MAG: tRNA pseudouridine(38-40) synthase TruA [Acidobacteriota bacterium]